MITDGATIYCGNTVSVTLPLFQHYELTMGKPGTYGGHPEVFAVANIFNAKVIIFFKNAENQKPVIVSPPSPPTRHFTLLHSGAYDFGHYDVLY